MAEGLHIMCERDVGLFSLVQQVIANIPWALKERRIPIACFQARTCYWTPAGYAGRDTVWEYYFEPVVHGYPVSVIPEDVRNAIALDPPSPFEPGYSAGGNTFVSAHFGDHPALEGKTLFIPYLLEDPGPNLREQTAAIIRKHVRPRPYIEQRVERFYSDRMAGRYMAGVHIRGTDAVSKEEVRQHRAESLQLPSYVQQIERILQTQPEAGIFVATDAESSLDFIKHVFGTRVITYDSMRHGLGDAAGKGPTGWIMPAYIAQDRNCAARNGEEAVIEYHLLSRCDCLIHNGSGLARTVLLKSPHMPHVNTHGQLATARTAGYREGS
jgi:hypothetical protein